jgi:hypothetical protein
MLRTDLIFAVYLAFHCGISTVLSEDLKQPQFDEATQKRIDDRFVRDVLKRTIDVNELWLKPQPVRIHYKVQGNVINSPHDSRLEYSVWLDDQKSRMELQFSSGEHQQKSLLIANDDGVQFMNIKDSTKVKGPEISDLQNCLGAGLIRRTALQVIAQKGLPENVTLVSRNPISGIRNTSGEIVTVEVDLKDERFQFGVGTYQVQLGNLSLKFGRTRISIRLPEHVPVLEELVDHDLSVQYSRDQFQVGHQCCPHMIRVVNAAYRKSFNNMNFWEMKAEFQMAGDHWLLKRAENLQDGVVKSELVVSDVTTDPIDDAKFRFDE